MSKDRPDTYLNDRLDWNLLRTFRVIGQELSISRAAARLHLTQPAVSQALKRLEEHHELAGLGLSPSIWISLTTFST